MISRYILINCGAAPPLPLENIFGLGWAWGTIHRVEYLKVDSMSEIENTIILFVLLLLNFRDIILIVDFGKGIVLVLLLSCCEHIRFTPN